MRKADYPDRKSLEEAIEDGMASQHQVVVLDLVGGGTVDFRVTGIDDPVVSGTTNDLHRFLVTVDLNTREVTVT